MKRLLRNHGLSVTMFALFIIFLIGQSIAGYFDYNQDQAAHRATEVSYLAFLRSGKFLETVFENWESEFLQMGLYVVLTAFLFQKGSSETKIPGQSSSVDEDPRGKRRAPRVPWPVRKGGLVLKLYENSLSIALLGLFLISFALHALSGVSELNQERAEHGQGAPLTVLQYLGTSRFWFESFQNWQSEFLSVGVLLVFSIFLRQKGSPQSKPVAMPHGEQEAA